MSRRATEAQAIDLAQPLWRVLHDAFDQVRLATTGRRPRWRTQCHWSVHTNGSVVMDSSARRSASSRLSVGPRLRPVNIFSGYVPRFIGSACSGAALLDPVEQLRRRRRKISARNLWGRGVAARSSVRGHRRAIGHGAERRRRDGGAPSRRRRQRVEQAGARDEAERAKHRLCAVLASRVSERHTSTPTNQTAQRNDVLSSLCSDCVVAVTVCCSCGGWNATGAL